MNNINAELVNNLINTNLKLWEQNETLRGKITEKEKFIETLEDRLHLIEEDNNKINENKLYRFRRGLEDGRIFICNASDDNVRGIGKTKSIAYYASKYHLQIVVDLPSSKKYIEKYVKDFCDANDLEAPKIYTVTEVLDNYGVIKHGTNILVDILGLKNYIDLSREYNIVGGCVGVSEGTGNLLVL